MRWHVSGKKRKGKVEKEAKREEEKEAKGNERERKGKEMSTLDGVKSTGVVVCAT